MNKLLKFGKFLNKLNESSGSNLVNKIDYTLLKPDATEDDIIVLCDKADELGVKSVCVLPNMVKIAADALRNSDVLVCSVISFPHGTNPTENKLSETKKVISDGADEVDMVLNYSNLNEETRNETGDIYENLIYEVETIVDECHSHTNKDGEKVILKVIVESSMLNEEQTAQATEICIEGGADFIKTSTGMPTPDGKTGVAELNKVQIMKNIINKNNSNMQIKASGGIRTLADMQKFASYVDRFGMGYSAVDNIFGGQNSNNVVGY